MPKNRADRILLVFLVVALAGFIYSIRDVFEERVVQAGDSAPSFSIRADNGQTFSPTSFGGKLLVLNYWASWCPPCVSETPSLSEFQRQLKDSGVVVFAVSVDKSEKAYRDFLAKMKPTFVTARDPDANLSSGYGTFKFPETYVIRDGRVVQKYIGEVDWSDPKVVNQIRSYL